jgi:hypothetical protein
MLSGHCWTRGTRSTLRDFEPQAGCRGFIEPREGVPRAAASKIGIAKFAKDGEISKHCWGEAGACFINDLYGIGEVVRLFEPPLVDADQTRVGPAIAPPW